MRNVGGAIGYTNISALRLLAGVTRYPPPFLCTSVHETIGIRVTFIKVLPYSIHLVHIRSQLPEHGGYIGSNQLTMHTSY